MSFGVRGAAVRGAVRLERTVGCCMAIDYYEIRHWLMRSDLRRYSTAPGRKVSAESAERFS